MRRVVLTAQVVNGRVGHGEAGAAAGGVDVHRVRAVPRRRAGAVEHVLPGVEDGTGERVHVNAQPARAFRVRTVDHGFPGESRRAERVDDQLRTLDARLTDLLPAGHRLRGARGQLGRHGQAADRLRLGHRVVFDLTGGVDDHDKVAADDRQPLVGAVAGDVLQAGRGDGRVLDERVRPRLLRLTPCVVSSSRGIPSLADDTHAAPSACPRHRHTSIEVRSHRKLSDTRGSGRQFATSQLVDFDIGTTIEESDECRPRDTPVGETPARECDSMGVNHAGKGHVPRWNTTTMKAP